MPINQTSISFQVLVRGFLYELAKEQYQGEQEGSMDQLAFNNIV